MCYYLFTVNNHWRNDLFNLILSTCLDLPPSLEMAFIVAEVNKEYGDSIPSLSQLRYSNLLEKWKHLKPAENNKGNGNKLLSEYNFYDVYSRFLNGEPDPTIYLKEQYDDKINFLCMLYSVSFLKFEAQLQKTDLPYPILRQFSAEIKQYEFEGVQMYDSNLCSTIANEIKNMSASYFADDKSLESFGNKKGYFRNLRKCFETKQKLNQLSKLNNGRAYIIENKPLEGKNLSNKLDNSEKKRATWPTTSELSDKRTYHEVDLSSLEASQKEKAKTLSGTISPIFYSKKFENTSNTADELRCSLFWLWSKNRTSGFVDNDIFTLTPNDINQIILWASIGKHRDSVGKNSSLQTTNTIQQIDANCTQEIAYAKISFHQATSIEDSKILENEKNAQGGAIPRDKLRELHVVNNNTSSSDTFTPEPNAKNKTEQSKDNNATLIYSNVTVPEKSCNEENQSQSSVIESKSSSSVSSEPCNKNSLAINAKANGSLTSGFWKNIVVDNPSANLQADMEKNPWEPFSLCNNVISTNFQERIEQTSMLSLGEFVLNDKAPSPSVLVNNNESQTSSLDNTLDDVTQDELSESLAINNYANASDFRIGDSSAKKLPKNFTDKKPLQILKLHKSKKHYKYSPFTNTGTVSQKNLLPIDNFQLLKIPSMRINQGVNESFYRSNLEFYDPSKVLKFFENKNANFARKEFIEQEQNKSISYEIESCKDSSIKVHQEQQTDFLKLSNKKKGKVDKEQQTEKRRKKSRKIKMTHQCLQTEDLSQESRENSKKCFEEKSAQVSFKSDLSSSNSISNEQKCVINPSDSYSDNFEVESENAENFVEENLTEDNSINETAKSPISMIREQTLSPNIEHEFHFEDKLNPGEPVKDRNENAASKLELSCNALPSNENEVTLVRKEHSQDTTLNVKITQSFENKILSNNLTQESNGNVSANLIVKHPTKDKGQQTIEQPATPVFHSETQTNTPEFLDEKSQVSKSS